MKRIIENVLLTTCVVAVSFIAGIRAAHSQTIRIANNNPGATGGTNVYTGSTALQDAINAASSGDIIHVTPGSVSYGNVIISDKKLTILGIGLNPQKNIGQFSVAGDISLNLAGSSGTRISGMHFSRLLIANTNSVVHNVDNILCENSEFNNIIGPVYTNTLSNLIVRNCIINSSNSTGDAQAFEFSVISGVIITNNIIRGACCVHGSVQGDGLTIQNNLFYFNKTGGAFHNIDNSIVQNNIFYGSSPKLSSGQDGNTFVNNLVFQSGDDTFTDGVDGNTASGNIVADPLFTNMPLVNGFWNYSYDITLQPGSPALGAGQDGTDIGPSGGANPFDPEGTFLPLIEAIDAPAVVTQGADLKVNIKARGN